MVGYFLIHEGAHFFYALSIGAFRQFNFMGIGIQVDIYRERMSDVQFGVFNLVAPVATIILGYIFLALTPKFLSYSSHYIRAIAYYLTMIFLLLDLIYLSVLYPFVGGGDMNGIIMLLPKLVSRIIFGIFTVVNIVIIIKIVIPKHRQAYLRFQ